MSLAKERYGGDGGGGDGEGGGGEETSGEAPMEGTAVLEINGGIAGVAMTVVRMPVAVWIQLAAAKVVGKMVWSVACAL